MKFCLESFLQERWKQFPSTSESLSTPAEKKTLGIYSKCGKGGISDADIPACSSCLPRAARPACCFSSSQFSFVLFSACCISPCRSLFLWDCCYLSFTLCLDSRDCFPQPPLFAFAIIQLCLSPSVVISSGLSSSFPAEGRSMLGLVINSPRSFSGHLFKNWSLALCAGRKIMRQNVGFFFSLKTFGLKYKGVIFIIIIVVVILLQKYSSSQALSWCWWEWKEQNTQVCKMTWKPKFPAVKSLIVSSLPSWDKDHVEFIAKDPRSKGAEIKQSPQVTSELFVSTDSFKEKLHMDAEIFMDLGVFSSSCFAPIALHSLIIPAWIDTPHQLLPHSIPTADYPEFVFHSVGSQKPPIKQIIFLSLTTFSSRWTVLSQHSGRLSSLWIWL